MSRPELRANAYIFDFDGTLASIPVNWDQVKVELREVLGTKEELQSVFPTIVRLMKGDPKVRDRAFAIIDEYEERALPEAFIFPGSFDLLELLSQNSKVSLVTMQGPKAVDALLRRFELKQFLLRRFTREDATNREEQVRLALASMRVQKDDAIFVADRLHDLNTAKSIGVRFVMIRTHGDDPAEDDVPVFHSIEEFLSAIRALP